MFKYLILTIFCFSVLAQDSSGRLQYSGNNGSVSYRYVSMQDNKVFDVEIIVFAYLQPLPNYHTFQNKPIVDDSLAMILQIAPANLPKIKPATDSSNDASKQAEKLTVAIADEVNKQQALVWFEHTQDEFQLTDVWKKLVKNNTIKPLLHRAWRQPDTAFENPVYVKINNQYNDFQTESDYNQSGGMLERNTTDFSLSGMVALSKGRYRHFDNKINLFRKYKDRNGEQKNMVFDLTEKRQIKPDKLHYFDSPWLGCIVLITEFSGEKNEYNNE